MSLKNSHTRIDVRFNKELEDIKDQRLERKIDKKRISSNKITSMIPRHKKWEKIKEDIIRHIFEKEINFKDEE